MPSYNDLANFINHLSGPAVYMLATVFAVILITNFRGYWHTDREYQELADDRNEWKETAKGAVENHRATVEETRKLTGIVEDLTAALARRGGRS